MKFWGEYILPSKWKKAKAYLTIPDKPDNGDWGFKEIKSKNNIEIYDLNQIHSNKLIIIDENTIANWKKPEADGLITNIPNIFLKIKTADCVPVFLFDLENNVIGLIHSGWRSLQKWIIKDAIGIMKSKFLSNPDNILAFIGPAICQKHYPVGYEVAKLFPSDIIKPVDNSTYLLDVKAGVHNDLITSGLNKDNIIMSSLCTYEHNFLPSFRRLKDDLNDEIENYFALIQ